MVVEFRRKDTLAWRVTTEGTANEMEIRMHPQSIFSCTFPGCEKPSRNKAAPGLCPMHYHRQYRGRALDAPELPRYRGASCAVEECEAVATDHGYCRTHWTRVRRHGDPSIVLTPAPMIGPANGKWTDDPSYAAIHHIK